MELNIRKLEEGDWDTLVSWCDRLRGWENPPRDFLPDNGTGGFIVEKGDTPILAGIIYFTISKAVLVEWLVSNPDYKGEDRREAIEFLILTCEEYIKLDGKKYIFSIGRNESLINIHKRLGYNVDPKISQEIIKKL